MMSRLTLAIDRIAAVIVGLLVLALGLLALAWYYGNSFATEQIDGFRNDVTREQDWWPWLAALLGVLLVFLGLAWIFRHIPLRAAKDLALSGSSDKGRLTMRLPAVADAVCDQLAKQPGVHSARGSVRLDRGQHIIDVTLVAGPRIRLDRLSEAIERVTNDATLALGTDTPAQRILVHITKAGKENLNRVR